MREPIATPIIQHGESDTTCDPDAPRVSRPLRNLKGEELAARLDRLDVRSEAGLRELTTLEDELSRRTTPTARRLLDRVRAMRAGTPQPTQSASTSASTASTGRRSEGGRSRATRVADGPRQSVETILRELIGEEAERLARWGLAPGMPADMEALVLDEWRRRLGPHEDARGRSTDRLRTDVEWLAEKRQRADEDQDG